MLLDNFAMKPDPDFNRLLKVLRRDGPPDRVPFIELIVGGDAVDEALGTKSVPPTGPHRREIARENQRRSVEFLHRAGYDHVPCSLDVKLALIKHDAPDPSDESRTRSWVTESDNFMSTWEQFEQYPWPRYEDIDFGRLELLAEIMPDGMKVLGQTGGVFEYSSRIIGYETFCYLLLDNRELVQAVVDRVGQHLLGIYQTMVQPDIVGACWVSDDMGFKTQTMISPTDLRELIFPWHKRLAEVIHDSGKPVLLHSCGNLSAVMDDLIDDVGIDAKHSFEDVIGPVTDFKEQYGDRVGVLGGIDVDFLCRRSEAEIRQYVRRVLDACAPGGGYALGTGNSVANYVPTENYLAMLEEGWNYGRNST